MKFITEMELKIQYRKAPFSSYLLPSQVRLTPEARQFLVDRKIEINQMESGDKKQGISQNQEDFSDVKVSAAFQKTLAFFLLSFSLLLEKDVLLAEAVLRWHSHLEEVKKAWQQGQKIPTFQEDSACLEDNIVLQEISAFHIQLSYGRELAILNCLNASLVEISVFLNKKDSNLNERDLSLKQVKAEVEQVRSALLKGMTQMIRSERH